MSILNKLTGGKSAVAAAGVIGNGQKGKTVNSTSQTPAEAVSAGTPKAQLANESGLKSRLEGNASGNLPSGDRKHVDRQEESNANNVQGDLNEQKAEAPVPESSPVETGKVDSKIPLAQGVQTTKAPSILGTLGARSGAKAGDSSNATSLPTENASGHAAVATNQVATVAKKNLLTSTLTAVREKAEADKADHEYLFAPIPKDFQEVLNRFDDMMQRDHGILQIDLVRCRDFVKKIMIDLKENPEYDGLIIDRDVHNIIKFQRMLKSQAEEAVVTKTEKAAKRESKSKVKGGRFAVDMEAFDLNAPSQPKSIQDFSDLEL